VQHAFPLYVETTQDEYSQWLERGDIVVVSAPEGGEIIHAWHLCELIRTHHVPVVALSKNHPASFRLTMVVSAGDKIELNCGIVRGTHPEQHLICASAELSGIHLSRLTDDACGVVLTHVPEHVTFESVLFQNNNNLMKDSISYDPLSEGVKKCIIPV
jgi:hypothetical protein